MMKRASLHLDEINHNPPYRRYYEESLERASNCEICGTLSITTMSNRLALCHDCTLRIASKQIHPLSAQQTDHCLFCGETTMNEAICRRCVYLARKKLEQLRLPPTPELICGFCSRTREEVNVLVAGPSVGICDLCIEQGIDVLEHGPDVSVFSKTLTCTFSGSNVAGVRAILVGPHAQICDQCLDCAMAIIDEHNFESHRLTEIQQAKTGEACTFCQKLIHENSTALKSPIDTIICQTCVSQKEKTVPKITKVTCCGRTMAEDTRLYRGKSGDFCEDCFGDSYRQWQAIHRWLGRR